MVKIRLTRLGRKHKPFYRVIAIQAREKRESKALEELGHYDPMKSPSEFVINKERVEYWLGVGAQPTETVARLLAKEGLYEVEEKKFNKKPGKKKQERTPKKQETKENKTEPKETKKQDKAEDTPEKETKKSKE